MAHPQPASPPVAKVTNRPDPAAVVGASNAKVRGPRSTVDHGRPLAKRVEELLVQGAVHSQIVGILKEELPGVVTAKVTSMIKHVTAQMAREAREATTPAGREALRHAAVRRLQYLRQWALMGEPALDANGRIIPGQWVRKPNGTLAFNCECQIARLEGTEAPRKLDVTVDVAAEAMAAILVGLDAEGRAELEREAMAEIEILQATTRDGRRKPARLTTGADIEAMIEGDGPAPVRG